MNLQSGKNYKPYFMRFGILLVICFNLFISRVAISQLSTDLCIVTVDSLNRNVLSWQKPITSGITGFNIYRENGGTYNLIDFQDYDSISCYMDTLSGVDPNSNSYRYKIAVVDTLGLIGPLSTFHETIHLTASINSSEANLSWDNYEGFSFTYFRILRDSTMSNNWEVIDSVSFLTFNYTDLNVPSSGARYVIEVPSPFPCDPTKSIADFNSSRSNSSSQVKGPAQLDEPEVKWKVYPNPANDWIKIDVESEILPQKVQLLDPLGRILLTKQLDQSITTLPLSDIGPGYFFLVIENKQNRSVQPIKVR